jgi:hypothetical protein
VPFRYKAVKREFKDNDENKKCNAIALIDRCW